MKGREQLEDAAREARTQVDEAREALRQARAEAGGGRARSVSQAEQQLADLRQAIAEDVRSLRVRADGVDLAGMAPLRGALIAGAVGLVGLVGTVGVVAATASSRRERRSMTRQAEALAAALARTGSDGSGPRRGGRGLGVLLAGAVAVAGIAVAVRRRDAASDADDLWLPESPGTDPAF